MASLLVGPISERRGSADAGRDSPNRGGSAGRSLGSDTGLSSFLKPVRGVINLVQLIWKFPPLEEFIYGLAATGPVPVIVKGDEAPRHNPIVERFKAELNGFIPVRIDVKQCNLR